MGFFDEIVDTVKKSAEGAAQDVTGYLAESASQAIAKIGPKPRGNLSQKEIESGERGEQPGLTPSQVPAELLNRAANLVKVDKKLLLPALGLGALAGYLIFRK